MNIRRPMVTATILITTVLLLTPANIFSCGPFFDEAVFVSEERPAPSINDYLAGHLGVVQPTYYSVYLAIAYRVLSGKPIDSAEIAKAKKFWSYDRTVYGDDNNAIEEWLAARTTAFGPRQSEKDAYQVGDSFVAYRGERDFDAFMNCLPDAFRNAALTVQARAQHFGAGSPTMRDWVIAQNAVFSNCHKNDLMPDSAAADADPLIKADRAYQIAAAHFYREQFDDARTQFRQIARDHSSPWRTIAPYLAARSLIRQATLSAPAGKPADPKLLAQAQTELLAILADKNTAALHPAAWRTLGFVEFRLHPEQRLHTLALRIAGKEPTIDLGQDLIDYTRLLGQFAAPAAGATQRQPQSKAALNVSDDLTDWILTAGSQDNVAARSHALERWQQTHSQAWLIAALFRTNADDSEVEALLQAAAAVPDGFPAHDSASFQRARLLAAMGQENDARILIDRELQHVPAPPNQTRNLYLGLRWKLARNFDEFLKFAPQLPVEFRNDADDGYCHFDDCHYSLDASPQRQDALFDGPVTATLDERTPLALLVEASQSALLPQNLHQEMLLGAWSRAALLGDAAHATQLGKQVGKEFPGTAEYMEGYAAAKDNTSREFAVVFAMLHAPGMAPYMTLRRTPLEKIDDYRDNWWCESVGTQVGIPKYENGSALWSIWQQGKPEEKATVTTAGAIPPPPQLPPWPSFLSEDQRTAASAERDRLSHIGTAPNYFGRVVLAWVKAHPDDPRVPEALHLMVRSGHFGCTDRDTADFSRRAFELLHRRYAASEWTKQTPYWFK